MYQTESASNYDYFKRYNPWSESSTSTFGERCLIEEAFRRLNEEYIGREWLKPTGLCLSCHCRKCSPIC